MINPFLKSAVHFIDIRDNAKLISTQLNDLEIIKRLIHFSSQFRHAHHKSTHLSSAFLAIGGTVKYHLHKHLLCTILFNNQVEHLQGNVAKVIFLSASSKQDRDYILQLFHSLFETAQKHFYDS